MPNGHSLSSQEINIIIVSYYLAKVLQVQSEHLKVTVQDKFISIVT